MYGGSALCRIYRSFGGVGVKKSAKIVEPPAVLQIKMQNARDAIASQRSRAIKCPFCRRNSIIVFEDTRGHVQTKCKACGRETVFDVINMRKLR